MSKKRQGLNVFGKQKEVQIIKMMFLEADVHPKGKSRSGG